MPTIVEKSELSNTKDDITEPARSALKSAQSSYNKKRPTDQSRSKADPSKEEQIEEEVLLESKSTPGFSLSSEEEEEGAGKSPNLLRDRQFMELDEGPLRDPKSGKQAPMILLTALAGPGGNEPDGERLRLTPPKPAQGKLEK